MSRNPIRNGLFLLLSLFVIPSYGQIFNDECENAIFLGTLAEYCSDDGEFTIEESTVSPDPLPFCWGNMSQGDVWFTFSSTAPAAFLQVLGRLDITENKIERPSIAVYEGNCNNLSELGCNDITLGADIAELTVNGLIPGQIYYIRISSSGSTQAPFDLCVTSFVPVPSPESDCAASVVLCDTSPYQVENLNSVGSNTNEIQDSGCPATSAAVIFEENASAWYVWTCDQSGTLEFDLIPNNPNSQDEDLDFIVYELPNGVSNCDGKIALRCMFSGANQGNAITSLPCFGPTGLGNGATDTAELNGCQDGDDNYLAPLDMVSGVSYALVVNNFSQSGFGFSIEFGGTGTFLGPDPGFEITAVGNVIECEKIVNFEDLSVAPTDPIVSYEWSFGVGADPQFGTGTGPFSVEYESFGNKTAVLTVLSSRGCLVTEILDVFVEPCCKDTSTLAAAAQGFDIFCFGETSGVIEAEGINGAPAYNYSLDGVNFQPSPNFGNLPAGDYEVVIQDIKGCEEVVTISLTEPPPLSVQAGEDIEVDLGFTAETLASVTNAGSNFTIEWFPTTGLSCTDCLDPTIQAGGVDVYTVVVTDENGCTASDQLNVAVNIERPIYPPNIFSPNGDSVNDNFTIFVGPAVSSIDEIKVYDRWGNLMYTGSNLPLNDMSGGWDGTFKDEPLNPGVFTWIAKIAFIDNPLEPLTYTGDVTLAR